MPVPQRHPRLGGRFSRRRLIATATAVPLVWVTGGCTVGGDDRERATTSPQSGGSDPDVAVLASAAARVDELVALCERVLRERPELTAVVRPLLRTHRRHAEVLGSAGTARTAPGRSPDAPSTPSGTEAAEPLPRSRPAVLALLAAAEEDAAAAHRADVRRAESGRFAQLLASISAAETQHATTIEGTLEEAVR